MPVSKKMWLDPKEKHTLEIFTWMEVGLYTAVLGWILHNLWRFIRKEGRWKRFEISAFYTYAFVLIILRLGLMLGFVSSWSESYPTG